MVQYARMYGGLAIVIGALALSAILIVALAGAWASRGGRRPSFSPLRGALWVLAATCACATYVITLFPFNGWGSEISLMPFATLVQMVSDPTATTVLQLLGNVLLLSWVGLLLPALAARAQSIAMITLAGAGISVLIETLQYVTSSGRVTTVDDVILNTVGVLVGALIGVGKVAPRVRRLADGQPGRHGIYQVRQP